MLLRIALIILLFLFSTHLQAQKKYALNIGAGTAYYVGDLTEGPHNAYYQLAEHISLSYYINPAFSLRGGLTFGYIGASDFQAYDRIRTQRKLHFRSKIWEASLTGVYELIPDKTFGLEEGAKFHLSPYIFGGIAIFSFSPEAKANGLWYPLQPYGTEGQYIPHSGNRPYSLVQASVPLGIGLTFRIRKNVAINLEFGYRKTFTDYLDDVSRSYPASQEIEAMFGSLGKYFSDPSGLGFMEGESRGNPSYKDSYRFGMVSLTFFFDNKNPE